MSHSHQQIARSTRTLVWVVVLSVLAMVLAPLDHHLHHAADSAGQPHVLDLHYVLDRSGDDPHHDTHSLEPDAASALKAPSHAPGLLALLLVLVLLLPPVRGAFRLSPPASRGRPDGRWRHSLPPLRAPPIA